MRIFIGPSEIAGIASGLRHGFLACGVDADVVVARPHSFGYEQRQRLGLNGLWQYVGMLRNRYSRGLLAGALGIVHGALKWLVFIRALFAYDAFIYLFSKTITNTRLELMLMRAFRKRLIFVYVGSDIRPPYIGAIGQTFVASQRAHERLLRRARRVKQRVAVHERYADYIVNSPSTAQFHQQRFINWFSLGVPRHLTMDATILLPTQVHQRIRILHAPSKPLTKGTPIILEIIERLKAKGYDIDLVMIQNMPNSAVLEELSRCDFIVDEMYSDTPMAIFATEAAYFSKPAVIGGYFSDDVSDYIHREDIPPSMFVLPEHVEAAIERLIVDVEFRHTLGCQAKKFIDEHWSAKSVAGRYLRLIQGDVPDAWWFYPERVLYTFGCGVASERMVTLLRSFVGHCGLSALQLSHNPGLERRFAELVASDNRNSSYSE
jgi:hypothetical protein